MEEIIFSYIIKGKVIYTKVINNKENFMMPTLNSIVLIKDVEYKIIGISINNIYNKKEINIYLEEIDSIWNLSF